MPRQAYPSRHTQVQSLLSSRMIGRRSHSSTMQASRCSYGAFCSSAPLSFYFSSSCACFAWCVDADAKVVVQMKSPNVSHRLMNVPIYADNYLVRPCSARGRSYCRIRIHVWRRRFCGGSQQVPGRCSLFTEPLVRLPFIFASRIPAIAGR